MKKVNIITTFLLLFCKKRYQTQYGLFDKRVEYKRLFGKIYITRECYPPPDHPMCRCAILPIDTTVSYFLQDQQNTVKSKKSTTNKQNVI